MTNIKKIKLLFVILLSFAFISSSAQRFLKKIDKQGNFGLANGSLNFQGSIASGFGFGIGANLFSINSSSVSIGTNIKFGFENRYGLGYLALIADYFSPGSVSDQNNNSLTDFAEFPLFIHYNYGYGSGRKSTKKFGFYFGGGISYLITGYAHDSINSTSAAFYGLTADAGIRFNSFELGFSKVFSIGGPIPEIKQPAFYQITLSVFFRSWENK